MSERANTDDVVLLEPYGEGGPIVITKSAADLCVTLRNAAEYQSGGNVVAVPFPRSVCQRAVQMLEL